MRALCREPAQRFCSWRALGDELEVCGEALILATAEEFAQEIGMIFVEALGLGESFEEDVEDGWVELSEGFGAEDWGRWREALEGVLFG